MWSSTKSNRRAEDGTAAMKRAGIALILFLALAGALFVSDPAGFYPWAKAIHVIAVIAWMAGMLYLPRLFVYHAEAIRGSTESETFKLMEQRLLRAIINPAMIVTWAFGLYLAWRGFQFSGAWLHLKLALVLVLSGLHGYLSKQVRLFAADKNTKSARHWRIVNEVPALLMVAIVVLVIVKPF